MAQNPFADPIPQVVVTNHYTPQPQVSDIGFGYLNPNDNRIKHESVEIEEVDGHDYNPPMTPKSPLKSPLKSALKSPGAPPRNFDALKSPTFTIKEEEDLEKAEEATEKVQADDFVSRTAIYTHLAPVLLILVTESQDARPNGQVLPSRRKLLLLLDRPRHARHNLLHLQRHESTTTAKQPATMGSRHTDLATDHAPLHRLCLSIHVCGYLLGLRPRRSP